MSDRISTLRVFCSVARKLSFTATARELGLSQPSVSRIITNLETDLGVALFVRNTHAIRLTEAGLEYFHMIEPVLHSLEEANRHIKGDNVLRGTLRVGCAISLANREVIPSLPAFALEHPELKIDMVLTDSFSELIDEPIDVALRLGTLSDSTMVARKLFESPRLLAASPKYIERMGMPRHPTELTQHRIIIGPSGLNNKSWLFKKAGKELSIRISSQLDVNVNEASTTAAVAGLGIISISLVGCRREIENGDLIRICPDWELGNTEVHAILTAGRKAKPSAKAFVEYLVNNLSNAPRT